MGTSFDSALHHKMMGFFYIAMKKKNILVPYHYDQPILTDVKYKFSQVFRTFKSLFWTLDLPLKMLRNIYFRTFLLGYLLRISCFSKHIS